MGKTIGIIVGVIVLVAAAGAGGFYGGTAYAAQQATNVRSAFLNGRGGGGTGGGGFGGGGGAGGGGVFGTVKSVNGNTIQVSTAQNVTTVTISSTTNIVKTVSGAATDIQVGEQISARGQRDSSGNVTATSIQVVPAGVMMFGGRGGGGNGGANATPTP